MFFGIQSVPDSYGLNDAYIVVRCNTPQADWLPYAIQEEDGTVRFFPTLEDARSVLPPIAKQVSNKPEYQCVELWEAAISSEEASSIRIAGETIQEFCRAWNQVVPLLPEQVRKRLAEIRKSYLVRFGLEGVVERMKDRRLSQIFAEFTPGKEIPIASGEKDNVRWALWGGKAATDSETKERQGG
jgi:hypothetical protein